MIYVAWLLWIFLLSVDEMLR